MQFNQPFCYSGPPQSFSCSCNSLPSCNGLCPDVIGEGDITSVILPDGTVQYFFLPVCKWPNILQNPNLVNPCYPSAGAWYIRGPATMPTQQANMQCGLLKPNYPFTGSMSLCPPGFLVKFHSDAASSTTDLTYFFPRPHTNKVGKQSSCAGCQVHILELCDCATQSEELSSNNHCQTARKECFEINEKTDGHGRESPMSIDMSIKDRKDQSCHDCGCCNCHHSEMSIETCERQERKHRETYSTTTEHSLCPGCFNEMQLKKERKCKDKKKKDDYDWHGYRDNMSVDTSTTSTVIKSTYSDTTDCSVMSCEFLSDRRNDEEKGLEKEQLQIDKKTKDESRITMRTSTVSSVTTCPQYSDRKSFKKAKENLQKESKQLEDMKIREKEWLRKEKARKKLKEKISKSCKSSQGSSSTCYSSVLTVSASSLDFTTADSKTSSSTNEERKHKNHHYKRLRRQLDEEKRKLEEDQKKLEMEQNKLENVKREIEKDQQQSLKTASPMHLNEGSVDKYESAICVTLFGNNSKSNEREPKPQPVEDVDISKVGKSSMQPSTSNNSPLTSDLTKNIWRTQNNVKLWSQAFIDELD